MSLKRNKEKGSIKETACTPTKKCTFKLFVEDQCKSLPVKFPFLTTQQIKNKAVELWHQLSPGEKVAPLTPYRRTLRAGGKQGKFFTTISETCGESSVSESDDSSPMYFQGGRKRYKRPVIHQKIEVVSTQSAAISPEQGILKKNDDKKKPNRRVSFSDKVSKLDVSDQEELFENTDGTQSDVAGSVNLLVEEFDTDDTTLPEIVCVLPENLYHGRSNNLVNPKTSVKDSTFVGPADVLKVKESWINSGERIPLHPYDQKNTKTSKWSIFTGKSAKVTAGKHVVTQSSAFKDNIENDSKGLIDVYKFENSVHDVQDRKDLTMKYASPKGRRKWKAKENAGNKCKSAGSMRNKSKTKVQNTSLDNSNSLILHDAANKSSSKLLRKRKSGKGSAKSGKGCVVKSERSSAKKVVQSVAMVFKNRKGQDKPNYAVSEQDIGKSQRSQIRPTGTCGKGKSNKYKRGINSSHMDMENSANVSSQRRKQGLPETNNSSKIPPKNTRKRNLGTVPRKCKVNSKQSIKVTDHTNRTQMQSEDVPTEENLGQSSGMPNSETCQVNNAASFECEMNNNGSLKTLKHLDKRQVLLHNGHDKSVCEKQDRPTTPSIQVGKYGLRYRSPYKELNYGRKRPCYYKAATTEEPDVPSQSGDIYEIDISEPNSPEGKKYKLSEDHSEQLTKTRRKNAPRKFASAIASKCKDIFNIKRTNKRKYSLTNSVSDKKLGQSSKDEQFEFKEWKEKGRFCAMNEFQKSSQESSQECSQRSLYSVESSDESECERDYQLAQLNFELGNPMKESVAECPNQEEMIGPSEDGTSDSSKDEACTSLERDGTMENTSDNVVKESGAQLEINANKISDTDKVEQDEHIQITEKEVPRCEKSTICKKTEVPGNVIEQVCEVNTTSKEASVMCKSSSDSHLLTERRKELDKLKSKVDKVLMEVKDVKTKLKSHEMELSLKENVQEDVLNEDDTFQVNQKTGTDCSNKEATGVSSDCRGVDNVPNSDNINQCYLIRENNNAKFEVDRNVNGVLTQLGECDTLTEETNVKETDALHLSQSRRGHSTITPVTGVCKVHDLITPHNTESIVELTLKHVTKTPKKQKSEENKKNPVIDGNKNLKAKKCLESNVPIQHENQTMEEFREADVPDDKIYLGNEDGDIFDSNSVTDNKDIAGDMISDADVFLQPSLIRVMASAVESSIQKCQMDWIDDIKEDEADKEFLQSQGQLTVERTLRNLRSVVTRPEGDIGNPLTEAVCSPFCVSPALSGVTKLDIGMTPKVDGSNLGFEDVQYNLMENLKVDDSDFTPVDAVQTFIASDTDVCITETTDGRECPSHQEVKLDCQIQSDKDDRYNSTEDTKSGEPSRGNESVTLVDTILEDRSRTLPATSNSNQTKTLSIEFIPEYKKVLSVNQERSLLDLFDEPEASPSTSTSLFSYRSPAGKCNKVEKTDMLSGIANDTFFC